MKKITILVVDDHPLMHEALRGVFEDEDDLELIGEAYNGEEALDLVRSLRPDVVLLDMMMPVKDGLSAIPEILKLQEDARILVFSSSQEEERIMEAVSSGVMGYVTKDAPRVKLVQAIRDVGAGRTYLPQAVTEKLVAGLRQKSRREVETRPVEGLTEREREIFILIGEGASNQEIARRLVISDATVRTHVHHILQKLQLESRGQAILLSAKLAGKG